MIPPAPAAARPRPRRWRVGQLLLVLVVLGTTAGILRVVVESNMLIGRMTTDVATAQRRATNLSNTQREALRLLQDVTDVGRGTEPDAVDVRRGLLLRQLGVSASSFEPGSPEHDVLTGVAATLRGFRWEDLRVPARQPAARAAARQLVSQAEVRVKDLYGEQEKYFYSATLRSVDAKAASERALAGLVAMVVGLAVCSVVLLRRRSRTDLARAYDALRISEKRFRSLVQHASDLTVLTDAAGVVGYVSPAVREILDRAPDELTGHLLLDLVHADDRAVTAALLADLVARPAAAETIELRVLTRSGRVRTLEAVCRNLLADPAVAGVVWNARDVTERRALQDQLSHQAYHDALTGLPNRVLFIRRMTEALRQAYGGGSAATVLVDLDGFKNVNDTLGHAAGDELLQRAAERLRGCILPGDTVARLGGDEFAIVLPGGTEEHAVAVSRRVIAALRRPISAAGQELMIGASIGVAVLVGHPTAEDLLSDADIAMYAAKRGGKNSYQVFEQKMRDRTSERTRLEQQLARAVTLGQIEVHYQPIVDLALEQVTAVEALARWRSADGTIIEPGVFIPIAEEAGLIREIGGEVLRHACRTVQRWRRTEPGCERLGVAVNVSGWQILAADFSLHVADALAESGLPPEALTLEITESMLLDDSDTLTAELGRLRALRVRLAMDDFGAGHSSVSSLLRFEVDVLKIDRMFLAKSQYGQVSLVRAVAELGRTLGLEVVAEGVETPDQLAVVRAAQCDAVQGFLVSTPLPEADARIFLEWAASTDEIPKLLSRSAAAR